VAPVKFEDAMTEEALNRSLTNQEIDLMLSTYPDKIAVAYQVYQTAEAEVRRMRGKVYLELKALHPDHKETHLKSMVENNEKVYTAQMAAIQAEAEHNRLYEKLMCAKKLASLRAAF
jgi:hypothetical protein